MSLRCGSSSSLSCLERLLQSGSLRPEQFQSFLDRQTAVIVPESQLLSLQSYLTTASPEDPKRNKVKSFRKIPPVIERNIKQSGGAKMLILTIRGFPDGATAREPTIGVSWIELFGESWQGEKRAAESELTANNKRAKIEDDSATDSSAEGFDSLWNVTSPSVPLCRCVPAVPCVSRLRRSPASNELYFICSSRDANHCQVEINAETWKQYVDKKTAK